MEALLRSRLTAHYNLPVANVANIYQTTNEVYFEIEDNVNKELQIQTVAGSGMAKYRNENAFVVSIINYEKFLTSLPRPFQHGRDRCDAIFYTTQFSDTFF